MFIVALWFSKIVQFSDLPPRLWSRTLSWCQSLVCLHVCGSDYRHGVVFQSASTFVEPYSTMMPLKCLLIRIQVCRRFALCFYVCGAVLYYDTVDISEINDFCERKKMPSISYSWFVDPFSYWNHFHQVTCHPWNSPKRGTWAVFQAFGVERGLRSKPLRGNGDCVPSLGRGTGAGFTGCEEPQLGFRVYRFHEELRFLWERERIPARV